ncbi:MAG: hypothetical protein KBC69_01415 [Candidatus Magasanikbacteria bacterium]|nr:hypothetical protein [Candidatus Magasanikbacteria bacterium]
MEELRKEIFNMVEDILVFDPAFKERMLVKIINLSAEKLGQLKGMLVELIDWQEEVTVRLINQNPTLYNQILNEKMQFEKEAVSLYKEKMAAEDHNKMQVILHKIQSL